VRSRAQADALLRQALHEFGLADRPQFLRPLLAVHRVAGHEHRRHDVVAAAGVAAKFVQQVGAAMHPEVMVGIADRELRIQRVFLCLLQPLFTQRVHALS